MLVTSSTVSILVLMEYALLGQIKSTFTNPTMVSILVLMEYALLDSRSDLKAHRVTGLNPCFNGICSTRVLRDIETENEEMSQSLF